jgi:membrane-bound serine protease (ClpP class)
VCTQVIFNRWKRATTFHPRGACSPGTGGLGHCIAMFRYLTPLLVAVTAFSAEPAARPARVVVIPVRDEIAAPELFIVRRGLKEAIAQEATVVVLDMKTPGGALDTTFEIMEALAKFPGHTITYVNPEAMSAGAFISATTEEIWFAPDGVIGAAAPVLSDGKDVETTMKQKIVSYLKARMRAISEGRGYRGEVVSAMIDADKELKIGDKVVKEKGELLSLTATEAMKNYGEPPKPLLGAGVAKSLDELLEKKFGHGGYTIHRLEITWSERLAVVLNRLAPIFLGLGMLAIFIEFKTPGFGLFGGIGIALLAVVFLTNYVAGLSGHEPILFFALGVLLVILELLFWHSAGFLGVGGVVLMGASLLWSMADLWPNEPLHVAWSADAFARPLLNMGLGLSLALALFAALLRFLPSGWVWDRLVVQTTSGGAAQVGGVAADAASELAALIGRRGVAATALRPAGQVEVGGRRYEAKVDVGALDPGTAIIVTGCADFALTVEKAAT